MRTVPGVDLDEAKIADFCRRHRITKLQLFGSVLRKDFHEASDVDVLYEFEPGKSVGMFGLFEMERELSELIGRQVDMGTPDSLSVYIRDRVMAEAETIYVRR
jgi:predicted nucleotidyltransferase